MRKLKFSKPLGANEFINNINNDNDIDADISTNTNGDISIDISKDINFVVYPWSTHNKKSVKKKSFVLRLNSYYMEAVRFLSNPEEGKSMQLIIQEIVTKELDSIISKISSKKK